MKVINENNKFIKFAEENLQTFKAFFDEDILKEVDGGNITRMMMLHIESLRRRGVSNLSDNQRQGMLKLLQAIVPLRDLMTDKVKSTHEPLRKSERK